MSAFRETVPVLEWKILFVAWFNTTIWFVGAFSRAQEFTLL